MYISRAGARLCVASATSTIAQYTGDAFVAQAIAQQGTVGTTTALRRLSVGEVRTNPAGMSFVVATYAITQVRPDGSSVMSTYDAYFVLQVDTWKLWFTVRR